MTCADFPFEKTAVGDQYLIPGTERRTRPKSTHPEFSREGDQYILPGTEPISTGEWLSRLAKQPIRPRCAQRTIATTALFGPGKKF